MRWPWLVSGVLLGVDQWTKWLVRHALEPSQSLPILPPILHLTHVQNTGAAFGLFKGFAGVLIVVSLAVIGWVGWEFVHGRPDRRLIRWAEALILGGATGNLIDRLRWGYVVDFIDLRVWPTFNVADSAITIGVLLILWRTSHPARRA